MKESRVNSEETLRLWLAEAPPEWASIIAVRAAMRVVPVTGDASDSWIINNIIEMFYSLILTWSHCTIKINGHPIKNERPREFIFNNNISAEHAFRSSQLAYISLNGQREIASHSAAEAAYAASTNARINADSIYEEFWKHVNHDCQALYLNSSDINFPSKLAAEKIWLDHEMNYFRANWENFSRRILDIDRSFSILIEWFDRRINGAVSGFNIPGDEDRQENRNILIRLLGESYEDFWGKGAVHVNTKLQGWLDEARARVAPPEAPAQDGSAITYSVNHEGKVDRLGISNQQQLRDLPDQRQIYADVRAAFIELSVEGQRLGETLANALARIERSMPEAFEGALAYLVWRDGNRLRRIYLAHRAVAHDNDPDPARLEPAIAEQLAGALDLFNLFAMGDDGLRSKDEATIPFQERASAEAEAALAKPVVAAILDTPGVLTEAAFADLRAASDDDGLPSNDPYAAQTRVQTNTIWRNVTAAMFSAIRSIITSGSAFTSKQAAGGVIGGVAYTAFTDAIGTPHVLWPLIEFIATNASALSAYAATAFSNYRVDLLIDAALRYFKGK